MDLLLIHLIVFCFVLIMAVVFANTRYCKCIIFFPTLISASLNSSHPNKEHGTTSKNSTHALSHKKPNDWN